MKRIGAFLAVVVATSVAGLAQDYRFANDEFDGSARASTNLRKTAPNPTSPFSGSEWEVFVTLSATRTEGGIASYLLGIVVRGEDWSFPDQFEDLLLLVRTEEGGEWKRELLPFASKWSDVNNDAKTVEIVGFDLGSLEALRTLCGAVAIKFRLQGHHTIERLFAPGIVGFSGFDDFVAEKF